MKIAIIGRGLIGSAAARHLALMGHDVHLIGPPEPSAKATHTGVFASHYDEGRITRSMATHPFWSKVAAASIARYPQIEAASGISFFTDCGAMMAGRSDGDLFSSAKRVCKDRNIPCRVLSGTDLTRQFPYFNFPSDHRALYEPAQAGHISPRRLVAAQTAAARQAGARISDSIAERIEDIPGGIAILTPNQRLKADQVLVATGGMTDHLLPTPMGLKVLARTVVYFEISRTTAQTLGRMPSLVFEWDDRSDPYLLPPIRYPDGKIYIKLGGDPKDVPLTSPDQIGDWFRSDGDRQVRDYLTDMFRALMPNIDILSIHTAPCMTTYTSSGLPVIGRLSDHLSVATGGNGAGAKCSDDLGRLGAQAVLGNVQPPLAPPL